MTKSKKTYSEMLKGELLAMAQRLGLTNLSRLRKDEIIDLIKRAARRSAAKKAATKKTATKKTATKKTATKKTATKKTATKKTATKKTAAKKTATTKTATKKTAAKKTAATKAAITKTATAKTTTKATTKKTATKKPATKVAAKKKTAKKTATKKTPTKAATKTVKTVKKATTRKVSSARASTKKTTTRSTGRSRRYRAAANGNVEYLPEELQGIDERLPVLPDSYGENRIVLLPRDPGWLFAYWNLTAEYKEAARAAGGATLAIRLFDVTEVDFDGTNAQVTYEHECAEWARSWYLPTPAPSREYVVEIGYRGGSEWFPLARSKRVSIPSERPERRGG